MISGRCGLFRDINCLSRQASGLISLNFSLILPPKFPVSLNNRNDQRAGLNAENGLVIWRFVPARARLASYIRQKRVKFPVIGNLEGRDERYRDCQHSHLFSSQRIRLDDARKSLAAMALRIPASGVLAEILSSNQFKKMANSKK